MTLKVTKDGVFSYDVERLDERTTMWAGRLYIGGAVQVVRGSLTDEELSAIDTHLITILDMQRNGDWREVPV